MHNEILKKFRNIFPEISSSIKEWFPNGKNSIRVRSKNGSDFIFTYNNSNNWRYETVESFLNKY